MRPLFGISMGATLREGLSDEKLGGDERDQEIGQGSIRVRRGNGGGAITHVSERTTVSYKLY
jgi:hypothetical protein